LNNNRANNRRRGRGNNNRPQNGGQQLNRIDSRARGNAPQMLEKYRKLAQDAHLNGDRVQAEYYLQFADHYFRVIADTRLRQEEIRRPRDDRWQENGESQREESDDSGDFSVESDFPNFDTPPVYTRREREERPQESRREEPRREEPRRREEPVAAQEEAVEAPAPSEAQGEENIYEPPQNPFLRENRSARGLRPRRDDRRPRRDDQPERETRQPEATDGSGLEASLPPAIASSSRKAPEAHAAGEEAPEPKPRRARRKPVADAGDTSVESVG